MSNSAAPASETQTTDAAKGQDAPAAVPKVKKNPLAFIARLSSREKAIAAALGLIVIFFAMDWVLFRPINKHLNRLSATIREKEDLIPKKLAVLNRKDEIEGSHKAIASYLTDPKLSQEEEIAAYLGEIERVSQRVGLFVSNINPVQTEEVGSAYHLKVDVEGAGSIANIKEFISSLEEVNPTIRVSAISLRGQGANTDELRFRFSIIKLGFKAQA